MNVVEDLNWTSLPKAARKEAPRVEVHPYKLTGTSIKQSAQGYINLAKNSVGSANDFYEQMYDAKKAGNSWWFPFFTDEVRSFGNSFADSFSNMTQSGGKMVGADAGKGIVDELAGLAATGMELYKTFQQGAGNSVEGAGTYIETPQMYQFENSDAPLNVSFVLSNTLGGEEDVSKNQEFITEFSRLCRPERQGSVSFAFPHIFKVKVPGLRFIRWATVDNFSVRTIGTKKYINNKVVPEGYGITISFKSLTIESANFLDEI
jgi:hypothetical protein